MNSTAVHLAIFNSPCGRREPAEGESVFENERADVIRSFASHTARWGDRLLAPIISEESGWESGGIAWAGRVGDKSVRGHVGVYALQVARVEFQFGGSGVVGWGRGGVDWHWRVRSHLSVLGCG